MGDGRTWAMVEIKDGLVKCSQSFLHHSLLWTLFTGGFLSP